MKVLILAAGEGARWGDHLGVPKHLVPLAGERLLDRTVRLVGEIAPDAQVNVVVDDSKDERYRVPGSRRVKARLDPERHEADKIASSRHMWSKSARTVILYGDVWFSTDAMRQILTWDGEGHRTFCRFDGSTITGAPGGEIFAQVITPDELERASGALEWIIRARQAGEIWRNAGWEWYRALCGVPDTSLLDHRDHGHSTIIDDFTEDMDTPDDWHNWCWAWAEAEVKPT